MEKLLILGDLFPIASNFDEFIQGNAENLFGRQLCQIIQGSSFRICNLEGALTDGSDRCEKTGPYYIAPTATINAIKTLGVDCCALANNHVTDAGQRGVCDTIQTLNSVGIQNFGAGESAKDIHNHIFITLDGCKVCVYNVAERMYNTPTESKAGVFIYDEYLVCKELTDLKSKCDYLMVLYHGGIEHFRYPSPEMRKRFHRMADSGADVVIAQHTHCIGCEEYYNNSYLQYGQGNFLFKNYRPGVTDSGLMLEFQFEGLNVSINRYKVRAENCHIVFDEKQDFSDYEERSSHLLDDAFIDEKFGKFCDGELNVYLNAFKGKNIIKSLLIRLFPKWCKNNYYPRAYNRYQLLFVLHTLRSEQNRETAITGISRFLHNK